MNKKIHIETPAERDEREALEAQDLPGGEAGLEEEAVAEPVDELEVARNEAKDNYDKYLRVLAEFDNYKKRAAKDREDYHKYANESFIKSLLPVIDYLEMGLDAARKSENADPNLLQGFELMANEFQKVLKNAHVEVIGPNCGDDFDPNFQECVMQEETGEYAPNKVCGVYQKGYKLYDHLLRPARVITSKNV